MVLPQGWRLQSGEVGCRGRGGLIEDGAGVWACVHGAIAAKIAAAQDAEETDRATVSRDPGLRWGSFWKQSAHERLASGSCRAGAVHIAARRRGCGGPASRGGQARGGRKGEKTVPTGGPGWSVRGGCGARAALLGCGAGEGVAALGELGLGGLLG